MRSGFPMLIRGGSSKLISALPNLRCEDQGSYEEIIGKPGPIFKQIYVIFGLLNPLRLRRGRPTR
jgi:hypothetical protein